MASGQVPVYEEGEQTQKTRARIVHNDYAGNLLLNTAQMRDGCHVQSFRIPGRVYEDNEVSNIIIASAAKELPRSGHTNGDITRPASCVGGTSRPASRPRPQSRPGLPMSGTTTDGFSLNTSNSTPQTASQSMLSPLPPGWEQCYNTLGQPYFINCYTRTSTWERPHWVAPSSAMAPAPVPSVV